MTDIKIPYGAFKRLVKRSRLIVFESANYLMTSHGPLTLWAEKRKNSKRIYADSIPYLKVGYLSISGSDVEKLPKSLITDIEEMIELIKSVPDEELSFFVTAILKQFDDMKETGLRAEIEDGIENWMNPETEEA